VKGWEVDGAKSGSYPIVGFGITSVEPLDSRSREILTSSWMVHSS
jgi:hypothetical protein